MPLNKTQDGGRGMTVRAGLLHTTHKGFLHPTLNSFGVFPGALQRIHVMLQIRKLGLSFHMNLFMEAASVANHE